MNVEKMQITKIDCGTKMHLPDIFKSSLFEAWLSINVIMTAFEWMSEGCTPPRLIVGQWCTGRTSSYHHLAIDTLYRLSINDKSNIINEAEIFLFTIWLDELRGICWKEHWAYNDEPFTASYEMHVWTTGWFPRKLMITYTWRVLVPLEASS